jgi:hypothetical protein
MIRELLISLGMWVLLLAMAMPLRRAPNGDRVLDEGYPPLARVRERFLQQMQSTVEGSDGRGPKW